MTSLTQLWEWKKKKKKWTIHKNLFHLCFLFCFPFYFSTVYQTNLNGTIPTQIGLMNSLQVLWEEEWKNLVYSFFSFAFPFILVGFLKAIWVERFQLKLDWWIHCKFCEKKKRMKWNEIFIKICFILLSLILFLLSF